MAIGDTRYNGRDTEGSGGLGSLEQYSENLSKSAQALLSAAQIFKDSSKKLNEDYKKSTQQSLKDMSKDFEKADIQTRKTNQADLDNRVKAGQALIKSFERVANYAIGKFTSAFSKIVSDYEANYTTITSRMNQSNKAYTDMLINTTNQIQKNGLKLQFSQVDFSKQLVSVLDTGLRGTLAENKAYQDMITNRLLPMINTNTKAYTRMSKMFGDKFTEGITAIGTYTEKMYGAEGLEEGQLDSVIETVYREISAKYGSASTDVLASIVQNYSQIASRYSSETAEAALNALKGVMTGSLYGEGADVATRQAAQASGIYGTSDISSRSAKAFFDEWVRANQQWYESSGGNAAILNQAGLADYNSVLQIAAGNKAGLGGVTLDEFKGSLGQIYEQNLRDLSSGKYQSKTAQQEKWNENAVAKMADRAAQYIPDSVAILGVISNTVGDWFNVWRTWETGKSGALAGGGGAALLGKGKGASLLAKIKGSSSLSSISGSSIATAGGALAGGAMALHGGISAFRDFQSGDNLQGGFHAAEAVGGAVGAGLLLASNPVGWAVLAAGAVAGVTAAVIEYNKVENVHARSLAKSQENLENLTSALSESQLTIDQTKTDYENLKIIQDKSNKGTAEYNLALSSLKDQYPEYLGYLSDDQSISESQVTILEKLIDLKRQQAELDANSALSASVGGLGDTIKLLESEAEINGKFSSESQAKEDVLKQREYLKSTYGLSDASSIAWDWTNGQHFAWVNGEKVYIGEEDYRNYKNAIKTAHKYDPSVSKNVSTSWMQASYIQGNPFTTIHNKPTTEGQQSALDIYNTYLSALAGYKGSYDNLSPTQKSNVQLALKGIDTLWDSLVSSEIITGREIGNQLKEVTGLSKEELSGIYEMTHSFKKGLNYVPGTMRGVTLHEGEMVLTKPTAQIVRELVSGESSGVRSLFNGISQVTASPLGDSASAISVVTIAEAVKEQTTTLALILNEILGAVKNISNINSTYSPQALNYTGF